MTRYRVALTALLILATGFYMWTAATSIGFDFSSHNADLYNLLTTSFLHGHTYLPITPPPGLLHLANPYDPAQNAPWNGEFHDLSLYNGHFYSQWGPTAVLTLFLPFRVTGLHMSPSFAVALYASIGLVCAVLLLHALVQRLVPRTPRWVLLVSSLGLALGNTLPFLLRRPVQYEVAISSGYCFEMAGLLLIVTAVLGPEIRRWRMAWGSLCLGLAIGGRPTLAVGGAAAVAVAFYAVQRRGEERRVALYALGPFIAYGLFLALYNHVRFGAFTNFGESYELSGIDEVKAQFYQLAYVPPGLFSYLLVPARLAVTFPYAFLQSATAVPFALPAGYAGTAALGAEPAGGLLTVTPIGLMLLAIPVLWWQRRADERRALIAATGLVAMGLLIVIVVSWALFGTTERYEVDFATLFLIPAYLVWALLLARYPPRSVRRRALAVLGVVFTLFGSAVGVAISFIGYANLLESEHPSVYRTLEDATSPAPTLAAVLAGKPLLAQVDNGPLPVALPPTGFGTHTERGATANLGAYPITLTVISPGADRLVVAAQAVGAPSAPPLSRLAVVVSSPGHPSVTAPMTATGYLRLPVHTHLGLNRIRLTLLGRPTTPAEVALTVLNVSD